MLYSFIIFAQTEALSEASFVKMLMVLIFWISGFAAAPILFTATMGVFRNLTGMTSGLTKGLRGKMMQRGNEGRTLGKEERGKYRKQRQARNAQIKGYNTEIGRMRRRASFGSTRLGSRVPGMSKYSGIKDDIDALPTHSLPEASADRLSDLKTGATELTKQRPDVRSGYAEKQASDIENQAAAFSAASKIADAITEKMKSNPNLTSNQARTAVLDETAANLLRNGHSMSQAEFTGTVNALGGQQAGAQLMRVHENAGQNGLSEKWTTMLSHSDTYGAVTKLNAGMGGNVGAGMSVDDIRRARVDMNLGKQDSKLAAMDRAAWEEMRSYEGQLGKSGETDKIIQRIEDQSNDTSSQLNRP